jgi:hypothetical protein
MGGNSFTLYTDVAQNTAVDSSAWSAYTSGDSIITFSRGYDSITHAVIENSMIIVGDDNGFVFKTTAGNLSQPFTEVKFSVENTSILRLTYGTITRLGTSWETTNAISGRVNKVALSDYEFNATTTDNFTTSTVAVRASGWELTTRTPHNPAYDGGEFGGEGLITNEAFTGIYNDDWLNEGSGPNLDIVIDVPETIHLFDRYGNIRLGGPIIYDRDYDENDPPIDDAVDSSNFQTAAANIRDLRNNDVVQTDNYEGWPNLVYIDSTANNATAVHHYYLPPGPRDGMEITFVGHGDNIGNMAVWVESGQAGTDTLTDNIWYPFMMFNGSSGVFYRTIAKAIFYDGTWYFDGNAWPD